MPGVWSRAFRYRSHVERGARSGLTPIGTIEGFYGPPWTHAQRLDHLRFAAKAGFDTVVYAPKDDPYHRRRWREPYPAAELARIGELAAAAEAAGVRFVYALHPALSMRYADDAEHARLATKAGQVHDAGVRSFALLFDDVPYELDAGDEAVFGAGAAGLGAAHGRTVQRFRDGFVAVREVDGPLLACPTDYAGIDPSPYREAFAASAPEDVVLTWTGRDVVVGSVTRADIDAAHASYRRPLVLWDNFPVNDFEPSRLFMGPLTGRTTELAGSGLVGVIANAMLVEHPSRIPLTTVAAWARDPAGYEPGAAFDAALDAQEARGLEPFVRTCSTWPPSAVQDPDLAAAARGALDGESSALERLEFRLRELATCCGSPAAPDGLVASLRPWLDGAAATARAGLAAAAALRGAGSAAATRASLAEAESHYANVLRPLVPDFVRAVLDRIDPMIPDGTPVTLLGDPGASGVRHAAELLTALGCAPVSAGDPASSALVVVPMPAAGLDLTAVAPLTVPVIAWGGLVELDLATAAGAQMLHEGVTIEAPDDPLAAGLSGSVPLYRGPGYVSVASVAPAATVVARGPDDAGRAVVFRYDAGTPLVSGRPAPALRIGLFPGRTGPAPWLLDGTGHALFRAAVRFALE